MEEFRPKFYWTGNFFQDAERINRPHIKKEGEKENRIAKTFEILNDLSDFREFTLKDVLNIQNQLLKENNWRGIKTGFRDHPISFKDATEVHKIEEEITPLFPIAVTSKENLLEWYRKVQTIHPLSDLNGRVFGIVVSVLNRHIK